MQLIPQCMIYTLANSQPVNDINLFFEELSYRMYYGIKAVETLEMTCKTNSIMIVCTDTKRS